MDRRRVKMIGDILVFVGALAIGILAVKGLYGMELEKSAKRKLYEEGKTDYYGNKVDE
jgi:hypothetical protein